MIRTPLCPALCSCVALSLLAVLCPAADGSLGSVDRSGRFGLGLAVPDPIGVTGKYFMDQNAAIDVVIGGDDRHREDFVLMVSYLHHLPDLWTIDKGSLPLYFGVGGRLALLDDDPPDNEDDEDLGLGIRLPVGVAWWTHEHPFELFGEVAPLFEFQPDSDVDLTLLVGGRYYF